MSLVIYCAGECEWDVARVALTHTHTHHTHHTHTRTHTHTTHTHTHTHTRARARAINKRQFELFVLFSVTFMSVCNLVSLLANRDCVFGFVTTDMTFANAAMKRRETCLWMLVTCTQIPSQHTQVSFNESSTCCYQYATQIWNREIFVYRHIELLCYGWHRPSCFWCSGEKCRRVRYL